MKVSQLKLLFFSIMFAIPSFAQGDLVQVDNLSEVEKSVLVKECLQKLKNKNGLDEISEQALLKVVNEVIQEQVENGQSDVKGLITKTFIALLFITLACAAAGLTIYCIDFRSDRQIMVDAARSCAYSLRCNHDSDMSDVQRAQEVFNAGLDAVNGRHRDAVCSAFPSAPGSIAEVYMGFGSLDPYLGQCWRVRLERSSRIEPEDYYQAIFS